MNTGKFSYLNSDDLKFIASGCFCSYYSKEIKCMKEKYKNEMRDYALSNLNKHISIDYLAPAFPNIYGLWVRDVLKKEGDVTKYFLNLGDVKYDGFEESNLSHNVILYRQVEEAHNNLIRLFDNEICAVKIIDLENNSFIGFGGIYENLTLDFQYLKIKKPKKYVLSHGATDKGLIVLRQATKEEFEKFKKWFLKHQKIKDSPFTTNYNQIKELMVERYSS